MHAFVESSTYISRMVPRILSVAMDMMYYYRIYRNLQMPCESNNDLNQITILLESN